MYIIHLNLQSCVAMQNLGYQQLLFNERLSLKLSLLVSYLSTYLLILILRGTGYRSLIHFFTSWAIFCEHLIERNGFPVRGSKLFYISWSCLTLLIFKLV